MPSRYYTYVRQKVSGCSAPKSASGKAPAGKVKTASWPTMPGKYSDAFKAAKKGIKEVNGLAMYKGLSSKSGLQQEVAGGTIAAGSLSKQGYKNEAKAMMQQTAKKVGDYLTDTGATRSQDAFLTIRRKQ